MPAFLIAEGRTTQKGETKMKQETKARIRVVGRILFLVYLLALVYFLFFAEEYGRRNFFELDYRYNLVPFQEIRRFWIYREKVGFLAAFLNLAGNVIGFLPFGFIVPVMHKKMESFWKVSLLGFMFSLCVETIQLITKVGCFDVDDLMLNTLGAMIGCGAFLICNKFRRWKYIRRDDCVSSQHITLSFQLLLSEALQSQSPMGIFIFAGGEFTVIVVGASNSNPLICDI